MDTMPSAEFRKTYSKLIVPTKVTVNGHAIGMWIPTTPDVDLQRITESPAPAPVEVRGFNSRPFTPVPKRGVRDLR
jgi:hypothetical protein